MALLTSKQRHEMLLAWGKIFEAICDKCGTLIPAGTLYNVRKWGRRKDKLVFLGQVPTEIECQKCEAMRTGKIKIVDGVAVAKKKDKGPPVGNIHSKVRKYTLRYLEESEGGFTSAELLIRLHRKSSMRDLTKKQIKETWKAMKAKKEIRKRKGKYQIVPVKGKKK